MLILLLKVSEWGTPVEGSQDIEQSIKTMPNMVARFLSKDFLCIKIVPDMVNQTKQRAEHKNSSISLLYNQHVMRQTTPVNS